MIAAADVFWPLEIASEVNKYRGRWGYKSLKVDGKCVGWAHTKRSMRPDGGDTGNEARPTYFISLFFRIGILSYTDWPLASSREDTTLRTGVAGVFFQFSMS